MKKIYIVDDDEDIVESMTMALESNGYEVKAQHDEQGLLENLDKFNPDLIILDVMFPGDHALGFKLSRKIHRNESTKNIPVLMLTGVNKEGPHAVDFSSKDIDEKYLPVTEFIEKPIHPKVLIRKVEELTSSH